MGLDRRTLAIIAVANDLGTNLNTKFTSINTSLKQALIFWSLCTVRMSRRWV
jgi:hypothetical protein